MVRLCVSTNYYTILIQRLEQYPIFDDKLFFTDESIGTFKNYPYFNRIIN
jgi:hypothetical protein